MTAARHKLTQILLRNLYFMWVLSIRRLRSSGAGLNGRRHRIKGFFHSYPASTLYALRFCPEYGTDRMPRRSESILGRNHDDTVASLRHVPGMQSAEPDGSAGVRPLRQSLDCAGDD